MSHNRTSPPSSRTNRSTCTVDCAYSSECCSWRRLAHAGSHSRWTLIFDFGSLRLLIVVVAHSRKFANVSRLCRLAPAVKSLVGTLTNALAVAATSLVVVAVILASDTCLLSTAHVVWTDDEGGTQLNPVVDISTSCARPAP